MKTIWRLTEPSGLRDRWLWWAFARSVAQIGVNFQKTREAPASFAHHGQHWLQARHPLLILQAEREWQTVYR